MSKWLAVAVVSLACACSSGGSSGSGGAGGTGGSGATGSGGTATGGSAGTTGSGGSGGVAGSTASGGSAGSSTHPIIVLETNMGSMTFELDEVNMPNTTANFLEYVDAGFYSDTIIHRVIPDFVIQGGGFSSGMVQKSTNPPIALETSDQDLHDYGALSMARTNDPNSATSQFFVVNSQTQGHQLDGSYAAFGHMTEGSAVLDAISQVATQSVGIYDDVPVTDVVVISATHK
jgi:cyclophilin family peptidyl-prolyl cis-trans isomerase